jgi:DNA topoisomerase IA
VEAQKSKRKDYLRPNRIGGTEMNDIIESLTQNGYINEENRDFIDELKRKYPARYLALIGQLIETLPKDEDDFVEDEMERLMEEEMREALDFDD